MKVTDPFAAKVDAIVGRDGRFDRDAYFFLRDALEFTTKRASRKPSDPYVEQHVSGQQLLDGVRRFALEQYGPMVPTVFDHWRVRSCEDIGAIVFNLIEAKEFGKNETDSLEDFSEGYEFHDAFVKPFLPSEEANPPTGAETRRTRPRSKHEAS